MLELPGAGGVGELAGDGAVEVLLAEGGAEDDAALELDLDGLPLFEGGGGDLFGEDGAEHVAVLRFSKRIRTFFAEDVGIGVEGEARAVEVEDEVVLQELYRGEFLPDDRRQVRHEASDLSLR